MSVMLRRILAGKVEVTRDCLHSLQAFRLVSKNALKFSIKKVKYAMTMMVHIIVHVMLDTFLVKTIVLVTI